jgi:hypothetical protein
MKQKMNLARNEKLRGAKIEKVVLECRPGWR